jgi:hypothetical protein
MSSKQSMVLLLALGLAACGGPSATAELNRRVNESHLAPVPMEQRQAIADAEQAVFLAQWQLEYTQLELASARTEIKLAQNERERVGLSAKTADVKKKRAEETGDQTRLRASSREEIVVSLAIAVADKELEKARKRVQYLEARLEAEKLIHRREEARAEYAKARSMTESGVRPPDVDPGEYESQYKEREQLAKAAIEKAQKVGTELAGIERTLTDARARLVEARRPPASAPPKAVSPTVEPPAEEAPAEEPAEPPVEEAGEGADESDEASSSDPDDAVEPANEPAITSEEETP